MSDTNIRTVTNGSRNILDGAIYFNCQVTYPEGAEIISWNKSLWQSEDYQRLFCPGRCQKDRFVIADGHGTCSTIKCFPCDCDKPKCQIYGTCCPDVDDSSNGLTDAKLPTTSTSHFGDDECSNTNRTNVKTEAATEIVEKITLGCKNFNNTYSYLNIRSCPANYPNNAVRTMCEHELTSSQVNSSTYLHATANDTHVTYFNEYCATCNGISEECFLNVLFQFTHWKSTINCSHFQKVSTAQNDEEFLSLSLRNDSLCNVTQIPPSDYKQYECFPVWFEPVVNTCNVTGRWAKYDADVATACAEQGSLLNHICDSTEKKPICYRNVFCAICNMNRDPKWSKKCEMACDKPVITDIYLPFSLLFNFGNSKRQQLLYKDIASSTEWVNLDGRHLPLKCWPGKILLSGICSSAIKLISGLGYKISILYVPKSSSTENRSAGAEDYSIVRYRLYLRRFENKVTNIINELKSKMNFNIKLIFSDSLNKSQNPLDNNPDVTKIPKPSSFMGIFLNGIILASSTQSRDDFENMCLMKLFVDEFIVNVNVNTSLSLAPTTIQENQKHVFEENYLKKHGLLSITSNIFIPINDMYDIDYKELQKYYQTLSSIINCPFVTFNKTDYEFHINDTDFPPSMSIILKLQTGDLTLEISKESNFLSIDDTEDLRLCQVFLQRKLSHLIVYISRQSDTLFLALEILTITCISLSMLFLVLTLLTYILLLELRNSAGENIICMCSSLFLAQASLIIASRIKQTGIFCTAAGISIHYLWLKVFCWCFTCSYHMFRVFTSKTRSTRSSVRSTRSSIRYQKDLLKKLFVCLTAPALVVITVIVGNLLSSEMKLIGYGEKHCSLNSSLLMFVTILTPVMGILLTNFLFYLVSVIQIHSVMKLQTPDLVFKQESSKSIYIYLKLSTVTGTFWIVTVISEATGIDALRVIAILLNGLQGVFIFVSFVCNKRVFNLYKQQFRF